MPEVAAHLVEGLVANHIALFAGAGDKRRCQSPKMLLTARCPRPSLRGLLRCGPRGSP
jgi:hypothetical protein